MRTNAADSTAVIRPLHACFESSRSVTTAASTPLENELTYFRMASKPRAANPNQPEGKSKAVNPWTISEKAEYIRWAFNIITTLCAHNPKLLDIVYNYKRNSEAEAKEGDSEATGFQLIVWEGLVIAAGEQEREATADSVQVFCTTLSSKDDEGSNSNPLAVVLPLLMNRLRDVYSRPKSSLQYFRLLRLLIKSATSAGVLKGSNMCLELVRLIRSHGVRESSSEDRDEILNGLLFLLGTFLTTQSQPPSEEGSESKGPDSKPPLVRSVSFEEERDPLLASLRSEAQALIPYLFHFGLFPSARAVAGFESAEESSVANADAMASSIASPPLCKHPQTRKLAMEVVHKLVRGNRTSYSHLLELLSQHHDLTSRGGNVGRVGAWNLRSTGEEKSGTGYLGLRNLGCICYMNATLQQFFLIRKFRDVSIRLVFLHALLLSIFRLHHPCVLQPQGVLTFDAGISEDQLAAPPTGGGDGGIADDEPAMAGLGARIDDMVWQLQRMYAHLMTSEEQYYDPTPFCRSFK